MKCTTCSGTISNRKKTIAVGAAFILAISSPAIAKQPDLTSLPMEHFRDTAHVKNDPLDTSIVIDTVAGFQEHVGLLRVVPVDQFLRGFVDKRSHALTIQVYEIINYTSHGWRFYETANYATDEGPGAATLTALGRDVGSCEGGGCDYTEQLIFEVPETLMRLEAAKYVLGQKSQVWLYKLNAKDGSEFRDGLSVAEIAGFLARVDDELAKLPPLQQGR